MINYMYSQKLVQAVNLEMVYYMVLYIELRLFIILHGGVALGKKASVSRGESFFEFHCNNI